MAKKYEEIPKVVQPVGATNQPVQERSEANRSDIYIDQPVLNRHFTNRFNDYMDQPVLN